MSGEELIEEARKYEKNLLNFFWRQGVSHCEGEDLVQETYLRLWKYRGEYKPTAKLSTFLFILAPGPPRRAAERHETREEGGSLGRRTARRAGAMPGLRRRRRPLGRVEAHGAVEGRNRARGLSGPSVRGGVRDSRHPGRDREVADVERAEETEGGVR